MGKKFAFGFVWLMVIYLVSCMLLGAFAGAVAGVENPQNASEAGRLAGARIVEEWRPYLVAGALLLSALGTATGVLPGTRNAKAKDAV